jgi:uncharacterized protein (DUF4415 family)
MTRAQAIAGNEAAVRGRSSGSKASKGSTRGPKAGVRSGRRTGANRAASPKSAGGPVPLHKMKISDFYRPLKKPVTLRLDADVIAWFKKDGKRYQTRINQALRKWMERERKSEK